jgi:hypothetical protein
MKKHLYNYWWMYWTLCVYLPAGLLACFIFPHEICENLVLWIQFIWLLPMIVWVAPDIVKEITKDYREMKRLEKIINKKHE